MLTIFCLVCYEFRFARGSTHLHALQMLHLGVPVMNSGVATKCEIVLKPLQKICNVPLCSVIFVFLGVLEYQCKKETLTTLRKDNKCSHKIHQDFSFTLEKLSNVLP